MRAFTIRRIDSRWCLTWTNGVTWGLAWFPTRSEALEISLKLNLILVTA